ncbi:hypothetical protein FHW12_002913 [Dokdonella fugitiva]|uniref:Uncharacterized protein n=1 Tax=Dokdonella fugitiva TaxID=328517 RepID=A0A839F6J3_9GAMM|nr:hypothetical protein [Dokdonella fugitiva]MBA8888680.1 hypothetical protein [Dokdonella fugitiva]
MSNKPIAILLALLAATSTAHATLNDDIAAACAGGGSVTVPLNYVATTTINLTCPGAIEPPPVLLQGMPSKITCQTGAAPCILIGSTTSTQRTNLALRDVYIYGPGRTVAGSEAIRFSPTADYSSVSDVRIDNFDKGIHFIGTTTPVNDLLVGPHLRNIVIGESNSPARMNVAVHLDGHVANVSFNQFHLSAYQRVILSDGPGGTGADATFIDGGLNTTATSGTAAVYISSSDGAGRILNLTQIQDWETRTPYIEVGSASYVTISGIGFSGDPSQTPGYAAFRILNTGTGSRLSISDAWMWAESNGLNLVSVEDATAILKISNSHIQGVVNFSAAAKGALVGNSCYMVTGTLTNVRMSANTGCADR